MKRNENALISLFAGAGGLDIGLELAGFDTMAVSELEPHACETLRHNQELGRLSEADYKAWFAKQMEQRCYTGSSPSERARLRARIKPAVSRQKLLQNARVLEGDIRKISSEQLMAAAGCKVGEPMLIAGGPPCQPFSRAGKRETVESEDGRLFLEFVRVVRDLKPRWFLFENVKGLTQSKTLVPTLICKPCGARFPVAFSLRPQALTGSLRSTVCRKCGTTGRVELLEVKGGSLDIVLNEFRSIGYHCHYRVLNAANFGVPQSRERLIIVGSRDNERFEWPPNTHFGPREAANSFGANDLFSASMPVRAPWRTTSDVLWKRGHPDYGRLDRETAVLWVKNVVRPHAEPVTWSLDRPSPTVGAHQAAKLALAPFGVPEEQLIRQQWHTKGKRQRDLPPVDVEHVMLSDEDLLRLQTFPTDWYLFGTRMQRAFQVGNAVPPALACAIGRAILVSSSKSAHASMSEHRQVEVVL